MIAPHISQERIGVAIADWKLSAADESILVAVDVGIRPFVRVLLAGGFETHESCQGGDGHAFPEPTVTFYGNKSEGYRAVAWLQSNGIEPMALRRFWHLLDGDLTGPNWEITFRALPPATESEGR